MSFSLFLLYSVVLLKFLELNSSLNAEVGGNQSAPRIIGES